MNRIEKQPILCSAFPVHFTHKTRMLGTEQQEASAFSRKTRIEYGRRIHRRLSCYRGADRRRGTQDACGAALSTRPARTSTFGTDLPNTAKTEWSGRPLPQHASVFQGKPAANSGADSRRTVSSSAAPNETDTVREAPRQTFSKNLGKVLLRREFAH